MKSNELYTLYVVICGLLLALQYATTGNLQGKGGASLLWLHMGHVAAAILPFGLMALAGLAESVIAESDKQSNSSSDK